MQGETRVKLLRGSANGKRYERILPRTLRLAYHLRATPL